jgi:uncharacterized RDD family membrane protein YckC
MSGARTAGRDSEYPGQSLQLPQAGPGSVAGSGRRIGALLIDWILCEMIALSLLHSAWWTLAIFAAETVLLTAFGGLTVGKRLLGIRVARLDGRPVGLGWALVRTVLLLTVIPAVMLDADLRGLHDKAANTVVIRI